MDYGHIGKATSAAFGGIEVLSKWVVSLVTIVLALMALLAFMCLPFTHGESGCQCDPCQCETGDLKPLDEEQFDSLKLHILVDKLKEAIDRLERRDAGQELGAEAPE